VTADALPYAQAIGYQLRRTYLRLHRVFGTATASQGITPDQYAALWVLVQQDGLTQRELTEHRHSDARSSGSLVTGRKPPGASEASRLPKYFFLSGGQRLTALASVLLPRPRLTV